MKKEKSDAIVLAIRQLNAKGEHPHIGDIVSYCDALRARVNARDVKGFFAQSIAAEFLDQTVDHPHGLVTYEGRWQKPAYARNRPHILAKIERSYSLPVLVLDQLPYPDLGPYVDPLTRSGVRAVIDCINDTAAKLAQAGFHHERQDLERKRQGLLCEMMLWAERIAAEASASKSASTKSISNGHDDAKSAISR